MDRHAWNERYREKKLVWSAIPNRFLVEVVSGLEPGAAYDLAGGEGRNAVWMAEHGWRVTVVDWSSVALEEGRRLADPRRGRVDFRGDGGRRDRGDHRARLLEPHRGVRRAPEPRSAVHRR